MQSFMLNDIWSIILEGEIDFSWFQKYQGLETCHTFLADQLATGTGSTALKSKITPSLPWNVVPLASLQLDNSGRSARAAKDDISTAQATAAQYFT